MSYLYVTEQGASIHLSGGYFVVSYARSTLTKMLPKENVDSIALFGNVSLSTQCMKECLKMGIPVTFYAVNGGYFGRLESTMHGNVERMKKQFACVDDEYFSGVIAQKILSAKIHNQAVILRRYERNNDVNVDDIICKMEYYIKDIANVSTIPEIVGYEGISARYYFQALSELVNNDFKFKGRTRQPPTDPFNSMLSLGYTLLMYEIYGILESSGLNPYAGFVHKDKMGHPALASDLMEEWRAVLIDSVVLSLVQGNEIYKEHFVRDTETGGVFLTKDGMKIFISKLENKFKSESGYIDSTYRMNYRAALKHQVQSLVKAIETDDPDAYMPIRIK